MEYLQDPRHRELMRVVGYLFGLGDYEDLDPDSEDFPPGMERPSRYRSWRRDDSDDGGESSFPPLLPLLAPPPISRHSRNVQSIRSMDWWMQIVEKDFLKPQPSNSGALKQLTTVVVEVEGQECSICINEFKKKEEVKSMPCQHMFHEECILTWLSKKNSCPYCRYKLLPILV